MFSNYKNPFIFFCNFIFGNCTYYLKRVRVCVYVFVYVGEKGFILFYVYIYIYIYNTFLFVFSHRKYKQWREIIRKGNSERSVAANVLVGPFVTIYSSWHMILQDITYLWLNWGHTLTPLYLRESWSSK